jgi:hypothetical protein
MSFSFIIVAFCQTPILDGFWSDCRFNVANLSFEVDPWMQHARSIDRASFFLFVLAALPEGAPEARPWEASAR